MSTKHGSRISKRTCVRPRADPDSNSASTVEDWRILRKRFFDLFAPPNVPHRRRDAHRFIDELTVLSTNGRMHERRPNQRLMSGRDMSARWRAGLEQLRAADPELHTAVERLFFEYGVRDIGLTLDERKKRALARQRKLSKVRARLQRAGLC